jgi:hypothetical protein
MSAAPRHCADAQGREAGSRATASVADIACRGDLSVLLTEFYRRAFADDLLGNVFVGVARLGLAAHLPLICDFWETVQFRTGAYWRMRCARASSRTFAPA